MRRDVLFVLSVAALGLLILNVPALAGDGCQNLEGTISAAFTGPTSVAGTVTGSLAGTVTAEILAVRASGKGTLHAQLEHVFTTSWGEIHTLDQAVLSPVSPTVLRMNTDYNVLGGTGIFGDATGFIKNHGQIDLETGTFSLRYHGRICGVQ